MTTRQSAQNCLKLCIVLGIAYFSLAASVTACGSQNMCPKTGRVCGFDKENVCFRHFDSECLMKVFACRNQRPFLRYAERFCELAGFMCSEEFKIYSENYVKKENITDVIYSIYKNRN